MTTTNLAERRRAVQRSVDQLRAPGLALEAAEAELESLDAQIAEQKAQAARQQAIGRLVQIAAEGSVALAAIEQVEQDADVALLALVERLSAAHSAQVTARRAFLHELRVSGLTLGDLAGSGADLAGVRVNLGGPGTAIDAPRSSTHRYPGGLSTAFREEAARRGVPATVLAAAVVLPERNDQ